MDALRSSGRPLSASELARITGRKVGAVTYHVKTLRDAGVVELFDEGRVRGALEYFYALVPENDEDLNDPVVGLQKLCGALTHTPTDGGYPVPVTLDSTAREQMQKLFEAVRPKVRRIVDATARRNAADEPSARARARRS